MRTSQWWHQQQYYNIPVTRAGITGVLDIKIECYLSDFMRKFEFPWKGIWGEVEAAAPQQDEDTQQERKWESLIKTPYL